MTDMTDKNAQALEAPHPDLQDASFCYVAGEDGKHAVVVHGWSALLKRATEDSGEEIADVLLDLDEWSTDDERRPFSCGCNFEDGFMSVYRLSSAAPSAAEPVAWPTLTNEMVYHAQDEFHILPPRMQRLWSRLSEFHVAPPAPSATSAEPAPTGVPVGFVPTVKLTSTPTVMDEKGEREAFETWYLAEEDSEPDWIARAEGAPDSYSDHVTENAWQAWQARATLPAVQPEAETSAEKAAGLTVPDECPHLIWFDDQDCKPLMFSGSGARAAALHKFKEVSLAWNAHLFVRVANNCRDDRFIAFNARLATPADAPVAEPVALKIPEELRSVEAPKDGKPATFAAFIKRTASHAAYMAEIDNGDASQWALRNLGIVADAMADALTARPPAPEEGKDAEDTELLNKLEMAVHFDVGSIRVGIKHFMSAQSLFVIENVAGLELGSAHTLRDALSAALSQGGGA